MSKKILIILLLTFTNNLFARSLYWQNFKTKAHLNKQGILEITETHDMVFTGDWNGGERIFNLNPGEQLVIKSLTKIDREKKTTLVQGNLKYLDHYKLIEGKKLRWRARQPSDPPFRNTLLTFIIKYHLTNVLDYREGKYHLTHDLGFPDREYFINSFRGELTYDENWEIIKSNRLIIERTNVAPGDRAMVLASFNSSVKLKDNQLKSIPGNKNRYKIIFIILLFITYFRHRKYIKMQEKSGRFKPLPHMDRVNEEWLNKYVLKYLPEEVGASWDEKIDKNELAGMMARLCQEKKLKIEVTKSKIFFFTKTEVSLERLIGLYEFEEHERNVLRGFFIDDKSKVNSSDIESYYRNNQETFFPIKKLEDGLAPLLNKKKEFVDSKFDLQSLSIITIFFFFGILLLSISWGKGNAYTGESLFMVFPFLAVGVIVSYLIAIRARTAIYMPKASLRVPFFWCVVTNGLALSLLYFIGSPLYYLAIIAIIILLACFNEWVFYMSSTRNGPNKMLLRQKMALARRYFKNELKKSQPNLKDEWAAYMIALGLGDQLDIWEKSYGPASTYYSTITTSSSATSSSGFTGGGGTFGGAGASGSFASSISSFSSSASSSSSSGGGGGSSGGGGGGGW